MKMVVKLAKALHVDNHTLNTMFIGYFVLLIVAAGFVVNKVNDVSDGNTITASSEVKVESTQQAN